MKNTIIFLLFMGSLSESWGQIHHETDGHTADSLKQELTAAYSPYVKNSMFSVVRGTAQEEDITAVYLGSTRKDSVVQKPKSRFYLSADLTGGATGYIYKNNKPDGAWLCGYIALMPLYRIGNIYVGLGGAIQKDYYELKVHQVGSKIVQKSFGGAINYSYGKKKVKYLVSSRMYYNIIEFSYIFMLPDERYKDQSFSYVIGWGPSFELKRFQLNPVLNINGSTFSTLYQNRNRLSLNNGFIINLNYNISK